MFSKQHLLLWKSKDETTIELIVFQYYIVKITTYIKIENFQMKVNFQPVIVKELKKIQK